MSLRDQLSSSRAGSMLPAVSFRKPRVGRARRELAARFTEAEAALPREELEEVAQRLSGAAANDQLAQVSRRDWGKAAWCLWLKGHELAQDKKFLTTYLKFIEQSERRAFLKKLASAYLRDFAPKRPNIELVGDFLARGVMKWDWVWADRQQRFDLFGKAGPRNIAVRFMNGKVGHRALLDEAGIGSEFSGHGMAAAAYVYTATALKNSDPDRFARVLDRVFDWSVDSDRLRYPGAEAALADALLLPWVNNNPPKEIERKIEEFLLTYFKDPRMTDTPGYKWTSVSPDTKAVFLRWLVGAALEQFLQVVDKVAMPSQWKYRRAFWMAYYKAGVIDEAWVSFAWKGRAQAIRIFGDKKGFGRLEGSGVSPDHAVLIMKIGGLTVADWSHNGKCHIWTASNRKAPKLYQNEYYRYDLVEGSSNDGVIHAGAPNGTWQAKVASYIGRNTGIRLGMREYMPKRRR